MIIRSFARYGPPAFLAVLLAACTARLPADLELLSVRPGGEPEQRLLEVAFASRVNLLRFVTVNGYSLATEADYCDGPPAQQPLVVSGLYWEGRPLEPGEDDPIERDGGRDSLLAYSFFLNGDKAAARSADLCFVVAGGNDARGYRSNTVLVPGNDVAAALRETPMAVR